MARTVLDFASDPSQPNWETPRVPTALDLGDFQTTTTQTNSRTISPRAESITRAQRQLREFCSSTTSSSSLKKFLATWYDPLQSDRLQPNALAWFQAAEPLAIAIRNDRRDLPQMLLAYGVRPERLDIWAALEVLENTGSKRELELFLEGGWNIDQPLNENATSILGHLVVKNQDLVEWCLSQGASPNAPSPMGQTVMHQAAAFGSLETLRLLVSHGGVITGTDSVAHAALAYCNGGKDRLKVIEYLLENDAPIDAYYMSHSEQWNSSTNSLFLTYGRQNALHFAITFGKKELVEMLLLRGADNTLTMFSLQTELKEKEPRDLASFLGHEDIAMLL